jgi:hypothetical protein
MSMSFGVATLGLATAFFIPSGYRSNPAQMIHGVHQAFAVLGVFTVISTGIFHSLRRGDGDNVSHQQELHGG